MAMSVPIQSQTKDGNSMTPGSALRQAWIWYISLMCAPLFYGLTIVLMFSTQPHASGVPADTSSSEWWFLGSIGYLMLAAPIAFALRSRMFSGYWEGKAVPPRTYLRGMVLVWVAFELAGLISLTGVLVSHSFTPCIMTGIAAFLFYAWLYPSGKSMVNPVGHHDDPEIYSEPR